MKNRKSNVIIEVEGNINVKGACGINFGVLQQGRVEGRGG
jgi:hypothetical protein